MTLSLIIKMCSIFIIVTKVSCELPVLDKWINVFCWYVLVVLYFWQLSWLTTEKQVLFFINLLCRAMAQMVICQHVTMEAQV